MDWILHNGATLAHLGYFPDFLSPDDPRRAKDQIHTAYSHGGGWHKFNGFTPGENFLSISYPGDPPKRAMGETRLRNERIVMYESAWVAIIQDDGSYEIARID
jgi:hypothetical protein